MLFILFFPFICDDYFPGAGYHCGVAFVACAVVLVLGKVAGGDVLDSLRR